MPTLGGITAWISIGDRPLTEYGINVEDDHVKCYVEVPQLLPPVFSTMSPGSQTASLPSPAFGNPAHSPTTSPPHEYAINWKIQDLTYTMVAMVRQHLPMAYKSLA
jgi:hypothetical protein